MTIIENQKKWCQMAGSCDLSAQVNAYFSELAPFLLPEHVFDRGSFLGKITAHAIHLKRRRGLHWC